MILIWLRFHFPSQKYAPFCVKSNVTPRFFNTAPGDETWRWKDKLIIIFYADALQTQILWKLFEFARVRICYELHNVMVVSRHNVAEKRASEREGGGRRWMLRQAGSGMQKHSKQVDGRNVTISIKNYRSRQLAVTSASVGGFVWQFAILIVDRRLIENDCPRQLLRFQLFFMQLQVSQSHKTQFTTIFLTTAMNLARLSLLIGRQ